MKPRTQRQREVVELAATLPPMTEAQRRWAERNCINPTGWQCKGQIWCEVCGAISPVPVDALGLPVSVKNFTCPVCGRRLSVKVNRRRKSKDCCYMDVLTTAGRWQVVRHYIVERYIEAGRAPVVDAYEVAQHWVFVTGHVEIMARSRQAMTYYIDRWIRSAPLTIKAERRYYGTDAYLFGGTFIYPHRRLLPELRRNGYTARNKTGLAEADHVKALLTDPVAEMLEKNGQYGLMAMRAIGRLGDCAVTAARIAVRRRYKITDVGMWADYVGMLDRLGLDIHNAHYVCPKNLKEAHDRALKRLEKRRAEERRRKAAQDLSEWSEKYVRAHGALLGLVIVADGLTIRPLQSVAEFEEEGRLMHHCVFESGYYKRPESLILTVRDTEGRRVETVEIDLAHGKIVQSRAECNGVSPRHDDIIRIITENMNKFKLPKYGKEA